MRDRFGTVGEGVVALLFDEIDLLFHGLGVLLAGGDHGSVGGAGGGSGALEGVFTEGVGGTIESYPGLLAGVGLLFDVVGDLEESIKATDAGPLNDLGEDFGEGAVVSATVVGSLSRASGEHDQGGWGDLVHDSQSSGADGGGGFNFDGSGNRFKWIVPAAIKDDHLGFNAGFGHGIEDGIEIQVVGFGVLSIGEPGTNRAQVVVSPDFKSVASKEDHSKGCVGSLCLDDI